MAKRTSPPKSILFLDVATKFGWCEGVPGGKPRYGSQRFAAEGAGKEAIAAGAIKWTAERFQAFRPYMLGIEAPLDPRHMGDRTNINTAAILLGLPLAIAGAAHLSGVWRIEYVRIDDIRRHLLGYRPPKATAKAAVIERLQILGYQPQDDNAADAIAGWLYLCAKVAPGIAAESSPLFAETSEAMGEAFE